MKQDINITIDKECNPIEAAETIYNSIPDTLRYELYRKLRFHYVKNDVSTMAFYSDNLITEEDAEAVARRYVYDGNYENNLSYSDNLENLLNKIHQEQSNTPSMQM